MWVQGDVLSHLISHRDRLLEEFLDAPRRHGVLLHHASIGWCIRCHGSDDQGQGLRRSCPLASTKLMPGSSSESGSREATAYSYWIALLQSTGHCQTSVSRVPSMSPVTSPRPRPSPDRFLSEGRMTESTPVSRSVSGPICPNGPCPDLPNRDDADRPYRS